MLVKCAREEYNLKYQSCPDSRTGDISDLSKDTWAWLRSELDKGIRKLESANITRKLAEIGAGQHF